MRIRRNQSSFDITKILIILFFCANFTFVILKSDIAFGYTGAISGATANTGRAAIEATDSPFMNPGAIAHLRGYYMATTYGFFTQQDGAPVKDFSISLTDNMNETVVPTSLGYNEITTKNIEQTFYQKRFQLGMGNFVSKEVAAGFGVRYQEDFRETKHTQTNLSFGALWNPKKEIGLAAVYENILQYQNDVPDDLKLNPSLSFGLAYHYKKVIRFKSDISSTGRLSFSRPIIGIGVESFANQWLITRVGVQTNMEKESNQYTFGGGFMGPKFALNYAYMQEPKEHQIKHAVDLTLPLW